MVNSIMKNRYFIEYVCVIAVSLTFWVCGLLTGTQGPMLAIIEEDGYHDIPPVSRTVSSWTITTFNIGVAVGSIISSYMSDILGRKFAILAATIPQVAAFVFMLLANNVYMIYASCIMRGLYLGVTYGIVPRYVGEITSAKLRGPSTVFGLLLLPIGALSSGIVQSVTSIFWTSIIMGILSICVVPFLFIIPESPYYYLSKNQDGMCKSVLRKLRRTENVDKEFMDIQTTWNELEKSKNVSWAELFTNKLNFRVLILVLGIQTVQQFTGYAPLFSYCTVIINEVELSLSLLTITLLINFVSISSTAASMFTVESLGRRILYIIVCIMSITSLGIVGTSFYLEHFFTSIALKIFRIFGMLLFMSSIAYGMGFFPNLLSAELFPSDIKAKGISVLIIVQSIQGPIVTVIYDQLFLVADYLPFLLFFITTLIGLILGYFYVPETKNKTLAEIQKELNLNS